MPFWIVKTEPSTYSFDDLERQKRATWDGVKNPVALKHIKEMKPGDMVMIYHTGDQKAIVGLADVVSHPYPDPKDPKLTVVDLVPGTRLTQPVTLAAVKADKAFADLGLVRMGRLSVMPVSGEQWRRILGMSKG